MRFDPDYQPERICAAASKRYSLGDVLLEPVRGDAEPEADGSRPARMVATDAHSMIIIPATVDPGDDIDDDDGARIPADVIKEARKKKGNASPGYLALNGNFELADGRTYPRGDAEGQFPDWRKVDIHPGRVPMIRFGIDPWKLRELAMAMGRTHRKPGVTVSIYDLESQIRVDVGKPSDDHRKPHGIIMPRRIEGGMVPDDPAGLYVATSDAGALARALLGWLEDRGRTDRAEAVRSALPESLRP